MRLDAVVGLGLPGVDVDRRCGLVLIIECCYACLGLVRGLWFCWFVSVGFGLVDLLLLVLIWAVVGACGLRRGGVCVVRLLWLFAVGGVLIVVLWFGLLYCLSSWFGLC